jgi:hypothetical protein
MATSNIPDAVLVDSTDRRWFIASCQLKSKAERELFLRENNDHMSTLYNALPQEGTPNRKYILAETVEALIAFLTPCVEAPSDTWNEAQRTQTAPMTEAKRLLIGDEAPAVVVQVAELLDCDDGRDPHPFINRDHISITALAALIGNEFFGGVSRRDIDDPTGYVRRVLRKALHEDPIGMGVKRQTVRLGYAKHTFYYHDTKKFNRWLEHAKQDDTIKMSSLATRAAHRRAKGLSEDFD